METTTSTEQKTSKSKLGGLLVLGAGLVFGGLVGFYGAAYIEPLMDQAPSTGLPKWANILVALPVVTLAAFVAILIHEIGHVVGGWLAGFDFMMLIVGPVRLTRHATGYTWEVNRVMSMAGGLAAMIPRNNDNLRRGMILLTAFGPLFSVLLGVALWPVVVNDGPWLGANLPGVLAGMTFLFLLTTAAISTMIALATLIPTRAGGFYSDGARLLNLLRGNEQTQSEILFITLYTRSMAGTRPRDYDETTLTQLRSNPVPALFRPFVSLYEYYRALDNGRVDEAGQHMDQILANSAEIQPTIKRSLMTEAAFYTAWARQDLAAARDLLTKGGGALVEPSTQARAEAAIAQLEGDTATARARVTAARQGTARMMDKGLALLERDLLTQMEQELSSQTV